MLSVITPSIRPQYLDITQRSLEFQSFQDFEWLVEIGLPSRGFTLPRDWNKLIKRAKGDVIVMLQDCISIPYDALEQITHLNHDKSAYTFPVGKQTGDIISWDWRHHPNAFEGRTELAPNYWEIDFASAPTSLFYDIGGFDEAFCEGWSWENVEIAWRAAAAGYTFNVSRITEGVALDHDKEIAHPFRNSLPLNAPRANETRQKAERGEYHLNYL